jgi:Mce-associated membrane protein
VEDQPVDTGDLTAPAPAATPQGKSSRNRHRLPRSRARDAVDGGEDATEEAKASDTVEALEPTVDDASEGAKGSEDAKDSDEISESDETDSHTEGAEDAGAADEAPEPEGPEPDLVPHRPVGRLLKIAAIVAGVIFVGAAAFAAASAQPYFADRARAAEKFQVAQTAANAISTLWSYAPDNIDQLPDRAAKFLSGDFAAEYRKFIDSIAAPNKQAQVTNATQVVGAAVESLTPTEATAIVYTNSVATSPATKGVPSLRYLSYRLTLVPQGGKWLVTKMTALTQLDLTPRV